VAQSLSPRMQNAAFAVRGLDWEYVALDVEPDRLEAAVRTFQNANVTAPYKRDVARILGSELDSVNTIAAGAGYSTDTAILELVANSHKPAIVGDGGAAQAFIAALPHARVFSRRTEWPPSVSDTDLVIHATPVRDEVLFELHSGQTLIDLPYNPGTATGAAAAANGARVIDGREVLVAQGAKAFELWTGVPAPVPTMLRAVGLQA
jgi:shikimate dehydrogenase